MLTIENSTGVVLAYLNNLTEAKIHEVLNGEYTLSFVAIIDHLKTDYLYDNNNLINYEDDLFRVVELTELHDEDDEITVAVTAEHISYDLINNVMNDFNHTYASAASVMSQCLLGTYFSLRSCDVVGKTDIQYTEECNSKQISIAIANNWRGELRYYKHYIDLLQMRGTNRGVDFRFGKNLQSIKRIRNFAENTLSYEVEVVQGSELEELGHFELGDTIRVIDDRLNADYEVRIIDLEKDILEGINSKIVLGDAIKDMRSSFSSVKQDVQEVKEIVTTGATDWNKINDILNSNGEIVIGKINTLTQIASKIVNNTGTFKQLDNGAYWQDQPTKEGSTFATFWGAEGLLFANGKLANGEWDWQTAISANGVIATEITSSCLNTVTANILSLVVDNLVGKTITGVTIKGSEFISDAVGSTRSMKLTNGSIRFMDGGSSKSRLDQEDLTLFALTKNNQLQLIAQDDSYGRDTMKLLVQGDDDFDLMQGNTQSRISMASDGGIYLQAGYGSERDVHISPRTTSDTVHIYGNIEIWGEKPAVVPTQHYGVRTLYCEEADKCYFSTKGIAETVNGECKVQLDDIFLETIELNSTSPYIIQLTSYSDARVWIDQVADYSFTVKSDKDTRFTYDLKAIRISYASKYLEEKQYKDKRMLRDVQESAVKRMSMYGGA